MRRKIPSTTALALFESAARHQSFTQAAQEHAVTQSAVCRQIAGLEDFLSVKLFRRTKRGVLLTEAGTNYARNVRARLDDVERDTLALMAKGGAGGALELGVVPTFAAKWLVPRLGDFQRLHPDITVHLSSRTRPFLFADTALDAAIFAGDAGWPGTESCFLMDERLVAVGSPALVRTRRTLKAADLAHLPLLQMSTRPYAWRQWFESLGLHIDNDLAGARMELFSITTEAAIHGQGLALIPRFLIEEDLKQGRLVPLIEHEFVSDRRYYFIYPEQKSENPVLRLFGAWLDDQATRYRGVATPAPQAA
ncbi:MULTISPECIES: LysR substrate-binding domain-containing protein [unclassified Polaromonas]|jgi:LysR family glycine cleavage system transcriptional activator|uniref:LysR substrate-binding domain-containing protein n=1 Tax=unclassified Polaromonas TaxID=2638319 RepID=UPI000BC9FFEA|nr:MULTISPECIES: LysR substrate-binding domain-containing protein [unclassified Polaromonas]OYY39722.1 MAG: LysR family transcriptional regulator [Polaromonas sp. 35-63-35]OYZ22467.1 MAG: LysR family transcriptional regulator [Polaromonas sp. 16-63-31]OYZ81315.1 MAG: LysR family transcriptional regulator [Polaromonas sp. 24-63-21]OZA52462.1 MAG: LysR family transcriptional regulator [Polaromonas sp. 17-63-33]OZA88676.1 MAG: LysR family transcriptional regulator [Polaromonas sp. 39-63-25]